MTEKEKQEIISELENRIDEKYKLFLSKENSGLVLKEQREKWFNTPDRRSFQNANQSVMANAFGHPFYAWRAWDNIRKLTCLICGKQYVRQLAGDKIANEICEKLCQTVFDLREIYRKEEIRR